MKEDFLLYKNGKGIFYSASIAATWIWAPEIYVTSQMGFYNGIWGPIFFTVPATFTLLLFGYFASIVRKNYNGFTLGDIVKSSGKIHYYTSIFTSLCLLVCSTAVQLLGLFLLLDSFINIPRVLAAVALSVLSLLITLRHGIKTSIITDFYKLSLMLIGGILLFFSPNISISNFELSGVNNTSFLHLAMIFGITSAIGHITSPYVDQTFWQRVFSLDAQDVKKRFFLSAIVFIPVPIMFGLLGLMSPHNISDFNIVKPFLDFPFNIVISTVIISALISTLDSNLCAVSSFAWNELNLRESTARLFSMLSMAALLLSANVIVFTGIGIVDLFLIYGTMRTCVGTSIVLVILNRYNNLLPYLTLFSIIFCTIGYTIVSKIDMTYAFVFTVLAFIIPLFGYKSK